MNIDQALEYKVSFDNRQYIYTANSISITFIEEVNIDFITDIKEKIFEKLPKTISVNAPSINKLKIIAEVNYAYWQNLTVFLNEQLQVLEQSKRFEIGFENLIFKEQFNNEMEGFHIDDEAIQQELIGTASFLIRLNSELNSKIKEQLGSYIKIEEIAPNLYQVFFSNEFEAAANYDICYKLKKQYSPILNIEPVFNIIWAKNFSLSNLKRKESKKNDIITDSDKYINQKQSQLINFKNDKLYGDRDVQIAILDHYIELDHDAFKQNQIKKHRKDFIHIDSASGLEKKPKEYIAHGIACAGLTIGFDKNGIEKKPFVGFAAGCSLVNAVMIGTRNKDEYTNVPAIIKALRYAAYEMQVDVISCSWKIDFDSNEIKNLMNDIVYTGIKGKTIPIVVAAVNNTQDKYFPAKLESVITVGAVDRNGKYINKRYNKKYHSGWYAYEGSIVDISAPGRFLISTDNQDGINAFPYGGIKYPLYSIFYGTSAATPIVAAFIAILKSDERRKKKKPLTANQIKNYLSKPENVTVPNNWNTNLWGTGIINFEKLLNA